MSTTVFVDTETTGIDPVQNQVLTIGVVIDVDGEITRQETIPVHYAGGSVSPRALEVNGIDLEEHNQNAFSLNEALTLLNSTFAMAGYEAVVIAHNASFDKTMLEHEYARAGVTPHGKFRTHWLCTLQLAGHLRQAGKIHPPMGSLGLDPVLRSLGYTDRGEGAHGALEDALLARKAYQKLTQVAGWSR